MTRKIKHLILRFSIAGLLFAPLTPVVVHAQANLEHGICGGAKNLQISTGGGEACVSGEAETTVNNLVTTIINIFSAVVGIVAVIMILYGGFKYITAGGDSSRITSAQHTIIYAIIGLIIVALAQIVVQFVLSSAIDA